MPDIKLGESGSEVTLPGGIQIEIPVNMPKKISKATMSDGSTRYAFYGRKRTWQLTWMTPLSLADRQTLENLQALNQVLKFQNNWESATWYDVVIINFSFVSLPIGTPDKHRPTMGLEEVT